MKKVLITGITGFVGKHLAEYLLTQADCDIIGTYRSETGLATLDTLKEKITLEKVDLLEEKQVRDLIASIRPDCIYHLAAMSFPGESFQNPGSTITNNILAELHVLDALKNNDMQHVRVIVIASSEVYGLVKPSDIPVDEETPFRPINPYAVSKIAQDYLALQYHLSYKLALVRARPFNHIGPGQREQFALPSFAKQIVRIEKGEQEPIIKVGNLDAKRDITDVRDMVKAYRLILEQGEAGEVYNIGSGTSHKIGDLLTMLLALSTAKIQVETDPTLLRPLDFADITCDYTKLHTLTGWKPEIPMEKTLQDLLAYYRKIR